MENKEALKDEYYSFSFIYNITKQKLEKMKPIRTEKTVENSKDFLFRGSNASVTTTTYVFPQRLFIILIKSFLIMFINRNLSFFSLIIVSLVIVKGNHISINWNISTDRGNSHFEREYKYPMYEEVAPVPCDLTDSCDVFCRQDADCDESQKQSFECSKTGDSCNGVLSPFDCSCDKFDKPEWLSVFCYVHKNPIYLGKFFKTPKKIEKFTSIKNHVSREPRFIGKNLEKEVTAKAINKYGSPVMTFIPKSDSFPSVNPLMIKTAFKDSSNACKLNSVSYRLNQSSTCFTKVSQELCQSGHTLSVFPYLIQDSNSSYNIPVVLKDLEVLKGIETEVLVKCIELKSTSKKFKKQNKMYFSEGDEKSCGNPFTTHTVLMNNTCQNVLVYVQHEFMLNGSDVIKLKVEYGLGELPLPVGYDNYKYNYLKQRFSVSFLDVMVNSGDKRNFSKDDELLNRGYFVGEELNFGYKSVKNNSTAWTKGVLGVFGASCSVSPVAFGFDHFSTCHIRTSSSNCSQLRKIAEEKLESLLKGDRLAVYQNLRPPYNNSVPLLRNYKKGSECETATVQDVLIEYTSIPTAIGGRLVHRVLGIRIERSFENVSGQNDLSLTSRVSFLFVPFFNGEEQTSRFWRRMRSREKSENSWLHMLNVFDDVTADEQKEMTLCWIFFVALISFVGIFTKFDLRF